MGLVYSTPLYMTILLSSMYVGTYGLPWGVKVFFQGVNSKSLVCTF